jgi:hypothetical protein
MHPLISSLHAAIGSPHADLVPKPLLLSSPFERGTPRRTALRERIRALKLRRWRILVESGWRAVIGEDPSNQIEVVKTGLNCYLLCRKAGTTDIPNPDHGFELWLFAACVAYNTVLGG